MLRLILLLAALAASAVAGLVYGPVVILVVTWVVLGIATLWSIVAEIRDRMPPRPLRS